MGNIRRWHKQRGFRDVGYHYIIRLNGKIEHGRPLDEWGAHAKGYNSNSIGICYIGGTDGTGRPKDTRTEAQRYALRGLIAGLRGLFPLADVKGHRDLSVDLNGDGVITPGEWYKACPSFDVRTNL